MMRINQVSHILVLGPIYYDSELAGRYGSVVVGPGVGNLSTRTPFNKGWSYEAWILEFENERLPKCAQND
jgi:hypothetical protein